MTEMFNYRTGQIESLPDNCDDYKDYVPQSLAAQGLYDLLVKKGKSPIEAAIEVLKIITKKARKDL